MLEHRFIDYRLARISSYCLDLLLLFAGCISVFVLLDIPAHLGSPFRVFMFLFSLMLLVYHGFLGLRAWIMAWYDVAYDTVTRQLIWFGAWVLFGLLGLYFVFFIQPVYVSGMHCTHSSCSTLRDVPVYDAWFAVPIFSMPLLLIPFAVAILFLYSSVFVVWMLCNTLLFRLLLKPQTLLDRPKYLWMLLLAAISASLYFVHPIVRDLMLWFGD
jgi:hypothetical protein